MHNSSYLQMVRFVTEYMDIDKSTYILDVGSWDSTYAYKKLFENKRMWSYQGLDLFEGENVDLVTKEPYNYPIPNDSCDVVVSGQTMEHVEDIYAFAKEIARILKPGGYACIIAPCSWEEHRAPLDCWRFFPDGMRYLFVKLAGLTEVKIYAEGTDCVAILTKKKNT